MPMPNTTREERAAFELAISAALPAFMHDLLDLKIPTTVASDRFGVKHYLHPELVQALEDISDESALYELLRIALPNEPQCMEGMPWRGSAEDLKQVLLARSPTRTCAQALLSWKNATGTLLGRLALKRPMEIKSERTDRRRYWTMQLTDTRDTIESGVSSQQKPTNIEE